MPGSSCRASRRVWVALFLGDRDRERYEADAPPDAEVGADDFRLVVGGEPGRELRRELEPLCAHEAGSDPVSSGEPLNEGFVEPAAFAEFGGCDHAGAAKAGDVVGDRVSAVEECLGGRLLGVFAE